MLQPQDDAKDAEKIARVLDLLQGMGVAEIVYDLHGCGDDGECNLESITMTDGSTVDELPDFTISFLPNGVKQSMMEFLTEHAIGLPEENWCDNDGGSGNVVFHPCEADPEDRIKVSMSYNDGDDEYDTDLDDVDFDEDEEEDDQPSDDADAIDQDIVVSTDIGERHAA